MRRRRPSVGIVLGGALAAAAVLTAAPSPAAPASAPSIRVPATGALVVHGRGYGHGHGLSQYGAEGAARKGLTAQQIVRFYYPHTTAGSVGGDVSVWISEDTDQNTTVVARRGLQVRDLAAGRTVSVPTSGQAAGATRWRMSSGRGGATRVSFRTDTWHRWRRLSGNGEFRSTGARLTLVVGRHRVTYRGTLRSMAPISATTHRITVNRVSLEGYVQGVVPREMPASWHPAALQAQAIAARSYAAYEAAHPWDPRFGVCDTTSCQVYGGLSGEDPRSNAAVAATKGQVREYRGAPAFTQFSASNGGWLAAGSQPYLVAKPDPHDGWSGNPVHTWRVRVRIAAVERRYPAVGDLRSISVTRRDGNGRWNGRVVTLRLVGGRHTVTTTGDDFRSRLGLRSTWFTLGVG